METEPSSHRHYANQVSSGSLVDDILNGAYKDEHVAEAEGLLDGDVNEL